MALILSILTIILGVASVYVAIGCERKSVIIIVYTLFLTCGVSTVWAGVSGL